MELGQKQCILQNTMKNRKVLLIKLLKTKVLFLKKMKFFYKIHIDLTAENSKGSIPLTKAGIRSARPDTKF